MKKFEYNGRNYQIANGVVHSVDNSGDFTFLDPVYRGDNVVFDAYCDSIGVDMYDRPQGIHTHGHQKGEARKPLNKVWCGRRF